MKSPALVARSQTRSISRVIVFAFTLLSALTTVGQTRGDSLNQRDTKGRRTGYWTFYLDSNFRSCDSSKARYYGYRLYVKGKTNLRKIGRFDKRTEMRYETAIEDLKDSPLKLDGALIYNELIDKKMVLKLKEEFTKGRLTNATEYYNFSGMIYPTVAYIFFDSLYKQQPLTSLYYLRDENILVYKQFFDNAKKKDISDKIFLVPHRDFRWLHRPIIGWHGYYDDQVSAGIDYVEFGFSRKFISGSRVDTVDKTYKKNKFVYHSVNFSLMGSNSYHQFSFGQKLTYGYNLLLLRGEAGLLNYTTFKKTDLSFIFGVGFTVFGYFNQMIYVSLPILTHKKETYPRFSFSFVIN